MLGAPRAGVFVALRIRHFDSFIAINVADVSQAVEVAKQLDVEVIRDAGPMNAGETK
jgi:hypothetical protein